MAITYASMAKVQSMTERMGMQSDNTLGTLLGSTDKKKLGQTGLLGAKNRNQNRVGQMAESLMPIAKAALATGPGRGKGLSASSSLGGPGSIFQTKV